MSIRRLAGRSVGRLTVFPANPPANNNPPVWDSQPAPVFNQGVASNFELDDLTSDPDLDTVTVSLNTGMASLPTGVTWNDTLDRLEYDGVGAIDTTTGHVATADDGTDTTDSASFSIVITAAVTMDNWPFVSCAFAIGFVNDRLDNHPVKGIIEANNCFVHQGLFFDSTANRASTKTRFDTLVAANADIIISIHLDFLTIGPDKNDGASAKRWLTSQVYANPSDFDEYFLREAGPGPFLSHRNGQASSNLACRVSL